MTLTEVVVSAVILGISSQVHQHWRGVAAAAQPAAELHAGEVRQCPVQNHEIKAFLAPTQQSVLAVVAADALMAGAAEFVDQEPQQFRVVIHDQQPARLRAQGLDAITSG